MADANGVVVQKNHYYPFGATFAESTNREEQPYQYNGKELDHMHGLELYDYGARMYDPVIGRWNAVDPAIEDNHFDWTPYAYVYDNPLLYIDLFGRDTTDINEALIDPPMSPQNVAPPETKLQMENDWLKKKLQ
ncbi:RHS repeat-associated core domain-containing protein [bacterium A37T11]|nr:RHS repeat-associated core domain-containing protein [bacterium A37T11]